MTASHFAGPLVAFGRSVSTATALTTPKDYNPDLGTSLFFGGDGIIDQRSFWAYQPGNANFRGWLGVTDILTLNYVPSPLLTANIAASQTPVTGTAMSLVTASANGVTVGAAVISANSGQAVTGLLLLDALTAAATGSITGNVFTAASGASGTFTVGTVLSATGATANTTIVALGTGTGGTGTYQVIPSQSVSAQVSFTGTLGINGVPIVPGNPDSATGVATGTLLGVTGTELYNPIAMLGRNVRITTQSGDTAVYTVAGYDIYGYPMTEAITANGASTVSGKKAFKYIASVTPVGTVGAAAVIGTGDVYGFPLASLSFQDVYISWAASVITASTGYLATDRTSPATTTTGDTRGTYAVQSASDGAKRLVVNQGPPPTIIQSTTGLFGVTQV